MAHRTGLEDYYVIKNQKKLRFGYTTGSCAAGAARGAAEMLLGQKKTDETDLMTPKGILLHLELHDVQTEENAVTCAVRKDAGDDPDTTNGILVYARVEKCPQTSGITIDGGKGVGRVTKAGLSQKVGEAAINPVPKAMILKAVEDAGYGAAVKDEHAKSGAKTSGKQGGAAGNGLSAVEQNVKNMKKRLISIITAASMVCTMPAGTFAADTESTQDGGEITMQEAVERFGNPDFNVDRKKQRANLWNRFNNSFLRYFQKKPYIEADKCKKCGVCVEACPVEEKALQFKNGRRKPPVYNYHKCIRCFCCQEMCPHKAIQVK